MVELAIRTVFVLTVLIVSRVTGAPPFDPSWRAAAFFATYSFLAYAMERRGMRNAGVSGLFAVADSAVVALLLSAAGQIEHFGFLTLLPPAWAALRFGADALAMSPIVAGWLLVGSSLFGGKGWTPVILAQTCGVLAIGLLGARRSQVVTVREIVEVSAEGDEDTRPAQDVFDLREKFRVLRDHASELERKGRRDRLVVQLAEAVDQDPEWGLGSLARKIRELVEVDGVTIHALRSGSGRLVVQAVAGEVPVAARDSAFDLPDFHGEWQLKEKVNSAMTAARGADSTVESSVVVLKDRGKIVGVLALYDSVKQQLAEAAEACGEIVEAVARHIKTYESREDERRRLRQAETLYLVASTGQGSDSPSSLAARVARELWETLRIDHLSVCFVEDGQSLLVSSHGSSMNVVESLVFPTGHGQSGWIADGAREAVLIDARDDSRLPKDEAIKRRIGSLVLVPLAFDETTYGYILAATHRVMGIDALALETLRLAASEVALAIARIVNGHTDPTGLATPVEFHEAVKDATEGHFVYLEVLKRDELVESHGRPAVDLAVRKLAARLRALLPYDGLVCRRLEGDFVAFLRSGDESFARTWAANASAAASMVAVTTPDGQTRIPLAVRSKVARLTQQSDQISTGAAS